MKGLGKREQRRVTTRDQAPPTSSRGECPVSAEQFFAGCALIGVLTAQMQHGEVNKKWACKWSRTMGALMVRAKGPVLKRPSRRVRRSR